LVRFFLTLAVLGIMLLVSGLFAPALIDYIETTTGIFATVELVFRVYSALFSIQLFLVVFFFLFVRPVLGLRQRLLLYFLLVESFILCSIFIFDDLESQLRSEESSLTFFSSMVLMLCAVGAFLNLLILKIKGHARSVSRVFWGFLALGFLVAALEEFFSIGEMLVSMPNWSKGLLVVAGFFGVLAAFYKEFRHDLFTWKNYFFRLLAAGIMVLGIAIFLDAVDHVFDHFLGRYYDVRHLCDSLEALMEFTAACLFCCACFTAVFEAEGGQILEKSESRLKRPRSCGYHKAGFAGMVLLLLAGLLGIKFIYGVPNDMIMKNKGCLVTLFAGLDDGLKGPDGLFFHADYGLIVCNEGSGELLVLDGDGQSRVLVNAHSGLISPEGLAVGANGIFVSDDSKDRVVKYQKGGNGPIEVFSAFQGSPEGLAIDSQGRLYIADEKHSMVVRLVDGQYEILASSLDGLMTPEEMAFDKKDNLYVTDEEAHSIFKISRDGIITRFADESSGLICPEAIAVHGDMIYVTDELAGNVFRFGLDGSGDNFLRFGENFRRISGITFDDRGFLYLIVRDPHSEQACIFKVDLDPGSVNLAE
jgi:sugar lactone lactonase YvrE